MTSPLLIDAKDRRVFFTADLHFDHANVIPYDDRPFADVHDMACGLIERWNDTVGDDDLVFVLGDFLWTSGGRKKVQARARALLDALNGEKILVCGNHDRPLYKHGTSLFSAAFHGHLADPTSNPLAIIKGAHKRGPVVVGMSHEPSGHVLEETIVLAAQVNAARAFYLHGHLHKQALLPQIAECMRGTAVEDAVERTRHLVSPRVVYKVDCPMVNVGVPVWDYRPVGLHELMGRKGKR